MDWVKFTKEIYEMDVDTCTVRDKTGVIRFGAGIGRVENYKDTIEILFDNDDYISLNKKNVTDICYMGIRINVIMNNGTTYSFDE